MFTLLFLLRLQLAQESLMFYRGETKMKDYLSTEYEQLKAYLESQEAESKLTWSDFRKNFINCAKAFFIEILSPGTKAARKAIVVGIFLVALEQFSGSYVFLFQAASFFERSGATAIPPNVAAILVGVTQLVGAYGATKVIDRLGRKPLLCIGCFGVCVSMTVFGFATQLIEDGNESRYLKIVPVVALPMSIFLANGGIFSVTFVILPEITPPKVISKIKLLFIN